MRTAILLLMFVVTSTAFSQTKNGDIFIKHDTAFLRPEGSEWIVKSLIKNDRLLTGQIGKSVPQIILELIYHGKIIATDVETNKPIPAGKMHSWKMPVDSVEQYDNEGNIIKHIAVQAEIDPGKITQIRVYRNSYMNVSTGKFSSRITMIDLMMEVYNYSGELIGYRNLARIYY
ncbi:hypothetical protein BH09BAC2_BH09BAC2_03680 [soil metagenome]